MKQAVCYSCGEMKRGALAPCPHCGRSPESDDDLILSIGLTDRYLDDAELEAVGRDIKQGKRPNLNDETRQQFQAHLEEFKKFPAVNR